MFEQPVKSRASMQVALMFIIIIATVLLGFFMMPSSQEEHDSLLQKLGTTNHGTLLAPVRPIDELSLYDADGNPWQRRDHKARWRLLIPSAATCEGACGDLLYKTRQVHIRLGKFTHRLERVLVATRGLEPQFAGNLDTEHPYLKVLYVDSGQFADWLANTNSPWQPGEGQAILVDPAGTAMMSYDTGHNGNGMLEDLNHLLKYSAD